MKKITTLFKKNPENLGRVINEVDPENEWVMRGEGNATRKYDGTAAAVIDRILYKRYDVKKGRAVPPGAIPCQDPDPITGHWPHWVCVGMDLDADRYFLQAMYEVPPDGTYELCGPKVQGNPEKFEKHTLVPHGTFILHPERTFEGIKQYLENHDIEGIVFHHPDGRMCKIRKSDFGIKR
jgi:hypothetical protein